jgi:hypothetical protein
MVCSLAQMLVDATSSAAQHEKILDQWHIRGCRSRRGKFWDLGSRISESECSIVANEELGAQCCHRWDGDELPSVGKGEADRNVVDGIFEGLWKVVIR